MSSLAALPTAAHPVTPTAALSHLSLVQPYGTNQGSCGYCHSATEGRVSYGAMAHRLTCVDYQDMIDYGWRRSGKYCYTLENGTTCCPNLTIRLNTHKFKPNKPQCKLLRRFNRFLRGEVNLLQAKELHSAVDGGAHTDPLSKHAEPSDSACSPSGSRSREASLGIPTPVVIWLLGILSETLSALELQTIIPFSLDQSVFRAVKPAIAASIKRDRVDHTAPACCSAIARTIAGVARASKSELHGPLRDDVTVSMLISEKLGALIAKGLGEVPANVTQGRVEVAVADAGILNFFFPDAGVCIPDGAGAYKWYDVEESGSPPAKRQRAASACDAAVLTPHEFRVDTVPAAFEKDSYALYKKYQMAVHGDEESECTEKQYTRFLCESPLVGMSVADLDCRFEVSGTTLPTALKRGLQSRLDGVMAAWECSTPRSPAPGHLEETFADLFDPGSGTDLSMGFGSFHQKYYVDNRLVAVGVVDILPSCLSSVYVFYDPSLPNLEMGKLTALREIQWVQRAALVYPRLKYYYMGYYVHQCSKMRYKADYAPSDVLCPQLKTWCPLATAVPLLDADKYAKLDNSTESSDADMQIARSISLVPDAVVLIGSESPSAMTTLNLAPLPAKVKEIVHEILSELALQVPASVMARVVTLVK